MAAAFGRDPLALWRLTTFAPDAGVRIAAAAFLETGGAGIGVGVADRRGKSS
jgi:hypothetical protein